MNRLIAFFFLATTSPLVGADRVTQFVGLARRGGENLVVKLAPGGFDESNPPLTNRDVGQKVWVASKDGISEQRIREIKINPPYNSTRFIDVTISGGQARANESFPVIISLSEFPTQRWKIVNTDPKVCSSISEKIEKSIEPPKCIDILNEKTKITMVSNAPESAYNSDNEWTRYSVRFYDASRVELVPSRLDTYGELPAEPLVDLDGDGMPEFLTTHGWGELGVCNVVPKVKEIMKRDSGQ